MTAAPPLALHGSAALEFSRVADPVVVVDDSPPKLDTGSHLADARAIAADARALLADIEA